DSRLSRLPGRLPYSRGSWRSCSLHAYGRGYADDGGYDGGRCPSSRHNGCCGWVPSSNAASIHATSTRGRTVPSCTDGPSLMAATLSAATSTGTDEVQSAVAEDADDHQQNHCHTFHY
ncbi:hypothetical protein FOZ63_004751, partial [Perkinsus olseni]